MSLPGCLIYYSIKENNGLNHSSPPLSQVSPLPSTHPRILFAGNKIICKWNFAPFSSSFVPG
jgi:hypothetical protein